MSFRDRCVRAGGFRFVLKAVCGLILTCPVLVCLGAAALAADADTGSETTSTVPNMYLDLRTYYARVPAGSLAFGFGRPSIFTGLPRSGSATVPATQSLNVDLPLTVDVSDSVSLYGGVSGSSVQSAGSGWSSFDITSWTVGFQADLYQQNGGLFPTVTWQSNYSQSVPNGPFVATSFNNIVEFDFALDADETRGLLAGIQHTRVDIGKGGVPARINPGTIGYVGGYYQWPNNWKFTGRVGIQSFEGAQLLNVAPIQPFTQPIVRFDLDRLDDNDNRLFGVTAEIMWLPKPAYQLTFRTPLYATRN